MVNNDAYGMLIESRKTLETITCNYLQIAHTHKHTHAHKYIYNIMVINFIHFIESKRKKSFFFRALLLKYETPYEINKQMC